MLEYKTPKKSVTPTQFLEGKKSYLAAACAGAATFAFAMGWIDFKVYGIIMGFLGSGGLASLRSGIKKDTAREVKKLTKEVLERNNGFSNF